MKNVKVIGYGLWVIGMLLVSMPTMAQQQEWQSTSTMKGTGSTYTPQVTAVGAVSANEMATTTGSGTGAAKAPSGPRRVIDGNNDNWQEGDEGSPIGDALIPLTLMAVVFCGVIYYRRRKALSR